jgi:hypothetical protein
MRSTLIPCVLVVLAACGDETVAPPARDGGSVPRDDGGAAGRDSGAVIGEDGGTTPFDGGGGVDAGMVSMMRMGPRPTGTVYLESHYEDESEGGVYADSVGFHRYVPGGGTNGSNAWEVHLYGDQGNEDHAGWTTIDLEPGTTQRLFVGYMLYVSAGMIERMQMPGMPDARPPGGKMHDAQMHPWSRDARQVVSWGMRREEGGGIGGTVTGIAPALLKGGAGGNYTHQRRPTQFDLRDYADQWIWIEVEMNAAERYTALWITTADGVFTGRRDEPLMHRSADDPADWNFGEWVEDPYVYFADGWATPGLLWGYWDDLEGVPFDDDDFVRLDDLYVAGEWIEPPVF